MSISDKHAKHWNVEASLDKVTKALNIHSREMESYLLMKTYT